MALNAYNDCMDEKPKFYCLDMFPYPSGAGLHVGHPKGYTATDIISRVKRMQGFNVLHPIGWDAFGLPAENYAIKTKIHPDESTRQNIENFKKQIKSLGFSYDWDREIDTSRTEYYKWTQWFFLFLYKQGLAYKAKAPVNWCPKCQTVLANEQAQNGKCERCASDVSQKNLEQWFFKITDFADDLISGLDKVDWPQSTKTMQKNWIGKSEGHEITFPLVILSQQAKNPDREILRLSPQDDKIRVFTTRIDTIFGCTYLVIAPEHNIISNLKSKISNFEEVEKYITEAKKKTDRDRQAETKEKTGVKLEGVMATNPATGKEIPVFIADYVLTNYGTGAIMAVPAQDQRDFDFAKKFNLPIVEAPNSWEMAEKGLAQKKINYKLRDWLVSRQRYWGAPIPIIYCEKCGEQPVPESDLPVLLPTDVDFVPHGESPLAKSQEFHNVKCPKCGEKARRESDTMDTFVCSSWYFFRFTDPHNDKVFADKKYIEQWCPVDLYVGGAEHTVLHLLYARFFSKALFRAGLISFDEPFLKLRHQGLILAEGGVKMSKSKGNVINPDDVVAEYGADTLRVYEMFMGPFEQAIAWDTKSIKGVYRFLEKIHKLAQAVILIASDCHSEPVRAKNLNYETLRLSPQGDGCARLEKLLHKTIKKVSEDIEEMKFNTAVSAMMILVNEMEKEKEIPLETFKKFLMILSPFAPYIAEELWQKAGEKQSIFQEQWPKYDPELVKDEKINFIVQINGKARASVEVEAGIAENDAKEIALRNENIKKRLLNMEIKKIVFVKDKLINFAV